MIAPYYFTHGPMLKPGTGISWIQRFRDMKNRLAQGTKGYSQDTVDTVNEEAAMAVSTSAPARK
jgi:hypothetical protein